MAADVSMGRKFSSVSLPDNDLKLRWALRQEREKTRPTKPEALADGNGVGITTVDQEGGRVP